ncbi:MAG: hypothetical protein DMD67_05570 [Gemmatimonadetes bacterium]|nr:MAG: hypothetical protein DMD67_05570 [Gemmatimonadota bacterium]
MDPLRHVTLAKKFALARELRRAPTPAERHAWYLLRNRGILGLKFRRQHVLHGFIVDFHCIAERLVIELEGGPHDDRVVRLRNRDVTRHHLERILRKALGRSSIVPPLPKGEGDRR